MSVSKPSAFGLLLLLALLPLGAAAGNQNGQGQNGQGQNGQQGGNTQGGQRSVPEFDPAVAGAIAAIVAGGGVVLARRRRR
jgi:hypothetical protein